MTDEQLAIAARAGDERAFEQLHTRHRPMLYGLAAEFFAPGLQRPDLRQAAAVGLVLAVRDWNPTTGVRFESFAHLCVRRNIITAVIAARRMKHGPLNDAVSFDKPVGEDDDLRLGDVIPDSREDPLGSLIARERLAMLLQAIRVDLSELERHVLIRFLNGATLEEIEVELEAKTGRRSTSVHPDGSRRPKITENALDRARRKLAELEEPRPLGVAA